LHITFFLWVTKNCCYVSGRGAFIRIVLVSNIQNQDNLRGQIISFHFQTRSLIREKHISTNQSKAKVSKIGQLRRPNSIFIGLRYVMNIELNLAAFRTDFCRKNFLSIVEFNYMVNDAQGHVKHYSFWLAAEREMLKIYNFIIPFAPRDLSFLFPICLKSFNNCFFITIEQSTFKWLWHPCPILKLILMSKSQMLIFRSFSYEPNI